MSDGGYCLLQFVLENSFLGRKVMGYVAEWWTMGSFVQKLGLEYGCELPIGKDLFPVLDGAGNGQRRRPASFLIVDDELSDVDDRECRADVLVRELIYYYCQLNNYRPYVVCSQERGMKYRGLIPPMLVHATNDLLTQIEVIQKMVQMCEFVTQKNQERSHGEVESEGGGEFGNSSGKLIPGMVLIMDQLDDNRTFVEELRRIIMIYRHIDLVPIIVSRGGYFRPVVRVNLDFVCLFPSIYNRVYSDMYKFYGAGFFSSCTQFMGIMNSLISGDGLILNNMTRSREEEEEGTGLIVWKNRHFSSDLIGSLLTRLSKYFRLP